MPTAFLLCSSKGRMGAEIHWSWRDCALHHDIGHASL